MILWGMGISQHVHGTDNARCLIALTMLTGQVGRPGTGLHPLRGQNNVQGASDAGLIPMMFPDYQRVDNAAAHDKFEALWGTTLDPQARAHRGRDHGRGARRARSAACTSWARTRRCPIPTCNHARAGARRARDARRAGHLPHRDRVSRRRDPAGLGVPGEDRHVHQHRPHGAARPRRRSSRRATRARTSTIIVDMGAAPRPRLELRASARRVRRRCARRCRRSRASPGSASKREQRGHLSVRAGRRPGRAASCSPRASRRASGRAQLVPAALIPAAEQPDARLSVRADHRPPARALAHRQHDAPHRGARRDRARARSRRSIPPTSRRSASRPGGAITVASRRGEVALYARADDGTPRGTVLHSVLLLRSGGERAHQSGARSVRQDSRVQVLRGAA